MIELVTILLIGFSVVAAAVLLLSYLFFLDDLDKTPLGLISCAVLLAALATFILEDPTTIACGLLVADGRMLFSTAMIGVASGIAIGDIGLYAIGRWAGPRAVHPANSSRQELPAV